MFAFIRRTDPSPGPLDDWVARTMDRFMSEHPELGPFVRPITEGAAEGDVIELIREALQAQVDIHGLRGAADALGIPLGIVRATLEQRDQKFTSLARLAAALDIEIFARPKTPEASR